MNAKRDDGCTPLHLAYSRGYFYIVKFLVSIRSVDVNIKDDDGYTLLHRACCDSELERVKLLVSSSLVDVNTKDNDGHTPLYTACEFGYLNNYCPVSFVHVISRC